MQGARAGSMIAATFGLIYVVVNTAALPAAVEWPLRALAVIAFVGILLAVLRGRGESPPDPEATRGASPSPAGDGPFGRGYWLVVAVEAVALFGGLRLLAGPLGQPEGGVAWVSFVVGVHFFALAVVLHAPFFNWLGAAVTLCGVVGLVLVFTGAPQAAIDIVGGVIPGALLLAFGWWGATNERATGRRSRAAAREL